MMDNSKSMFTSNVIIICTPLEGLGFILILEKCQLNPGYTCKFLGLYFNSVSMCVELPDTKRSKISKLIVKLKKKEKCGMREFNSFVGLFVSSCPAVRYGLPYTKSFEREKFLWLNNSHGNYDEDMSLSEILLEDFTWWQNNIIYAYQPIRKYNYCRGFLWVKVFCQ